MEWILLVGMRRRCAKPGIWDAAESVGLRVAVPGVRRWAHEALVQNAQRIATTASTHLYLQQAPEKPNILFVNFQCYQVMRSPRPRELEDHFRRLLTHHSARLPLAALATWQKPSLSLVMGVLQEPNGDVLRTNRGGFLI